MHKLFIFCIAAILLVILAVGCTGSVAQPLLHPKVNAGVSPGAGSAANNATAGGTSKMLQDNLLLKADEPALVMPDENTDTASVSKSPKLVTLCIGVFPSDGGSVKPGDCTTYDVGTKVTLIAEPAPCHYFEYWGGDIPAKIDKRSRTITITMDRSRNIIASLPYIKYNLTVNIVGWGGEVIPGKGAFDCGSAVTLKASPWCTFISWSGDTQILYPQNPVITIIMNSHTTLTATFVQ